jgi:hypothetical protein
MDLKIIFISVFCLLAVNSANAACTTNESLDRLKCLQLDETTQNCAKIADQYSKFYRCGPFMERSDVADFSNTANLDDIVHYAAFDDGTAVWPGAADGSAVFGGIDNMKSATDRVAAAKKEIERRYYIYARAYGCKTPVMTRDINHVGGTSIPVIISKFGFLSPICSEDGKPLDRSTTYTQLETNFKQALKDNFFGLKSGTPDRTTYFTDFDKWINDGDIQQKVFYPDVLYKVCDVDNGTVSSEFSCPPITIDEAYFRDNQSLVDKAILDKTNVKNANALKCLQNRAPGKRKVVRIEAYGSANTINNTGDLCAKGFIYLSQLRAKNAAQKIKIELAGLKDDKGEPLKIITDLAEIKTDGLGGNGDGTSGPCAYKKETNSRKLGTAYTKDGKDAKVVLAQLKILLAPYKYAKVYVFFEGENSVTKTSTTGPLCCWFKRPRREVVFNCADKDSYGSPIVKAKDVPSHEIADWVLDTK